MTISRLAFFLFFLSVITQTSVVAQQKVFLNGKEEVLYPVNHHELELASDLRPIQAILNDKEIISMGEATHGTKEFFDLKRKMFMYLAQEHDVKVFGIEDTYAGSLYINDYVLRGIGTIDSVMRRLTSWPWVTQEVKALIEWMRAYNGGKTASEKVRFYGYDIQSYYAPLAYLAEFVKKSHAGDFAAFETIIAPVYYHKTQIDSSLHGRRDLHVADTLLQVGKAMEKWFLENEAVYAKEEGALRYQQINLCLQNYREAVLHIKDGFRNTSFRDSCMAGMVRKIKDLEKEKLFIWAHNEHIAKSTSLAGASPRAALSMGYYLEKIFGDAYYAIGFLYNEGSFLALKAPGSLASSVFKKFFTNKPWLKGLQVCEVGPSPRGSIGHQLSQLNQPAFFMDLTNTGNELFTSRQVAYSVGAFFMNRRHSLSLMVAAQKYDGLIFVNQTTPTHHLLIR